MMVELKNMNATIFFYLEFEGNFNNNKTRDYPYRLCLKNAFKLHILNNQIA